MMSRPPLLLIPGLLCDGRLWQHQLAALADAADMTVGDHSTHDNLYEIAATLLTKAPPTSGSNQLRSVEVALGGCSGHQIRVQTRSS